MQIDLIKTCLFAELPLTCINECPLEAAHCNGCRFEGWVSSGRFPDEAVTHVAIETIGACHNTMVVKPE